MKTKLAKMSKTTGRTETRRHQMGQSSHYLQCTQGPSLCDRVSRDDTKTSEESAHLSRTVHTYPHS